MICEKCGCDYARSRPARPECGTPAPGYEKWATGGEWIRPSPAEGGGWRRFRRADAPRSAGRSPGLLVGSYLVGFACMAAAALLGTGLHAVCLALFVVLTPTIL